jgi:hypothetical protein
MMEAQIKYETTPPEAKDEVSGSRQKRVVMCGDLLQGGAIISGRGVEEWTDYPRYRVVAIHMNRVTMFLETLNSKGEIVGCEKMDFTSDQWRHWDT